MMLFDKPARVFFILNKGTELCITFLVFSGCDVILF